MAKDKPTVKQGLHSNSDRVVNVQLKGKVRDPVTKELQYDGSRSFSVDGIDLDEAHRIVLKAFKKAES